MYPGWTRKAVSPVRSKDTHAELFTSKQFDAKSGRADYLHKQETRARGYDIICGAQT